jgi:hypothetical protein
VEKIQLNESLAEGAMDFRLPKGTLVQVFEAPRIPGGSDHAPSEVDVQLIGDNGKVERTFHKHTNELKQWKESRPKTEY